MLFDGKLFAGQKEEALKKRVEVLRQKGISPKLVSILADDSKESELYISLKGKFAQRINVIFEVHHFKVGIDPQEITFDIRKANMDDKVCGIMVQLPVDNQERLLTAISSLKDVDCLTAENLGLIVLGKPRFLPATVKAVLEIIKKAFGLETEVEEKWLAGKNVCIVGASIIVGKPLALLLSDAGATVTVCRSTTQDLSEFTKRADILVSATGAAELVKKEMIKEGAVVIDVGISKLMREGKFRVVGDVTGDVANKASFLSPVPGGVGPVTVACLFENLLLAADLTNQEPAK